MLVTGGGLALERDDMAAAAANWGFATLAVAKAAQRKLVHILHKSLASDGIYVAEVTVMGGVSWSKLQHCRLNACTGGRIATLLITSWASVFNAIFAMEYSTHSCTCHALRFLSQQLEQLSSRCGAAIVAT